MFFPGCDLQTMPFHVFKGSGHIFLVSKIVVESRIILLVRSIAEDVSVTLSPKRYFVNVVECSSGLLQQNAKKK
jgi:hypothetical protein